MEFIISHINPQKIGFCTVLIMFCLLASCSKDDHGAKFAKDVKTWVKEVIGKTPKKLNVEMIIMHGPTPPSSIMNAVESLGDNVILIYDNGYGNERRRGTHLAFKNNDQYDWHNVRLEAACPKLKDYIMDYQKLSDVPSGRGALTTFSCNAVKINILTDEGKAMFEQQFISDSTKEAFLHSEMQKRNQSDSYTGGRWISIF